MTITHTLTRVVATDTDALRFIWSDGYELTQAQEWTGWFRGVTAGRDQNGEYERYDGKDIFDPDGQVLARFIAAGGAVEPYVAAAAT